MLEGTALPLESMIDSSGVASYNERSSGRGRRSLTLPELFVKFSERCTMHTKDSEQS